MPVFSVYVEKKPGFTVEAAGVLADLSAALGVASIRSLRIINRYFAQNLSEADFAAAKGTIFSEPQVDFCYDTLPALEGFAVFAVEPLPGQFDQRADSAAQCVSLAFGGERPTIRTAKIFALAGDISPDELNRIKAYLINPVESREAALDAPDTLDTQYDAPDSVETLTGFTALDRAQLKEFLAEYGLAMDIDDLMLCRDYFMGEKRDPTVTEIRMIDTYWSDHCRHTTFLTRIDSAKIELNRIRHVWREYLELRETLYWGKDRPITLMDLATIGAKSLKAQGCLDALDESDEVNACSVRIKVDVDGVDEDWLLMFKNETHNHPTEIEPFGGAATCLGGAIRDPLSGRSFAYQAMRITGAADPTQAGAPTLPGKLPQRKLVTTAAAGYSSYGNQVGLATGLVREIYHPGYVAKRMELGAVLGAVPAAHVVRMTPAPDDVVILLGGRTGRDGCGGATGSSKGHTAASLESCGAEVQKGNAPEERKLQRLFRNPEATRLIKRCNDFGAGGVSVAIGELADGLKINLDAVPKKYDGLDGTELAISESQERMAVVVAPAHVEKFIALADAENLEATVVATVTEEPRLVMEWRGKTIVDISREFLSSNGAEKHASIEIPRPDMDFASGHAPVDGASLKELMSGLGQCSQKGLIERFDSTVGAGTVLMPLGGAYQQTPAQAMAAKIPVEHGETTTCTVMAWGYNPEIACKSPYHAGGGAVIESVAKVIAAGGSRKRCWLSLQEYFERTGNDPLRWGKPAAALLGALNAQLKLRVAAIGGKDSMSGSFESLDVPPTIVSFAVSTAKAQQIISPEFKTPGNRVYWLTPSYSKHATVQYEDLVCLFDIVEELVASGRACSAWAVGSGGAAAAVAHMCFGNRLGFKAVQELHTAPMVGGFVIEAPELPEWESCLLGTVEQGYALTFTSGETVDLREIESAWAATLEPVFPSKTKFDADKPAAQVPLFRQEAPAAATVKIARPRVLIPVFPGTNCEYDTARAFEKAGAASEIFVVRNLTPAAIAQSVEAFAKSIGTSQIIAFPGGFSGGDEPDGSAKFITAFLRNPRISAAVTELLNNRDGLVLGVCNGFQALVKLGLVPYGAIRDPRADSPTLAFNSIGRHQSKLVRTKIVSNKSPWLAGLTPGDIYMAPVSHGEGRFIIAQDELEQLAANGQIATVYVDENGDATQDVAFNPNNSYAAVEGVFSPDGRVFGKMAHCERYGDNLYKNVPGEKFMDMFSGAVNYYG